MSKKTAVQKANEGIRERIKYLKEQESIALSGIDALASPSYSRDMQWQIINEFAARRGELEMYSLKPLQSLLPYERECLVGAYKEGAEDVEIKNNKLQYFLTAEDYFTSTYKQ